MTDRVRRISGLALALGFAGTVLASASDGVAQTKTTLTIYTTTQPDRLNKYRERIEKDLPDVQVRWVRDSTGIVTSKFMAEGLNSSADIILTLASTSLIEFNKAGLLLPYKPKDYDKINPNFRDKNDPPAFVGTFAYMAVICYNTVEGKRKNVPAPAKWSDLLNPAYKGQIVMANPNSSGTGLISVSGWLQQMGEQAGWQYMDRLHENIAQYTHSGSQPCTLAATGEYPVGISFESRGAVEKQKGAPIDLIFPSEGVGWAMSTVAIAKSTKNPEVAKRFVDWAMTESATRLFAEEWAVLHRPEFSRKIPHLPDDLTSRLIKNDSYWEADNRDRILKEWAARYSKKSEPEKKN